MKGDMPKRNHSITCPVCKGIGVITSPRKKMGMTEIKEKATIILRKEGFSYREIMQFTGYKSPRSIQKILEKTKKHE